MKPIAAVIFCVASATSLNASASIVTGSTRVIFDGSRQAASLSVENSDKVTNLVQSWISPAKGSPLKKENMIITPPLFRLEAGKKASIRIVRSGLPVPEDRESLLWLNVKGIPATDGSEGKNTMQIAINSKIKLIYRPAALKGQTPESSAEKLKWNLTAKGLQVNNPTPFYMNFSRIEINHQALSGQYFVAPFSTLSISEGVMSPHGKVTWSLINDYGVKGPDKVTSY
ncbi:fimbria/pilus periplasmic chaperone [Enterobacter hormaechei]|uniref:fimbria/pilus periplasmic chaperone n=1 Tax=Enterobacter cloacae complex TaxID=354276 RepID=UPI0006672D46|nr:fimbria/pilus periplasmic chaperone [Enterobacter hormaechei]QJP76866.1 fimbria/pilus periplasmic chaperone [Enterobacter cloacae]QXC20065.1 fimbria/pilus periplasmic chaperone [Enterobacter hormaechei]